MKPFEKRRGHMAISGGAGDSFTGPTSFAGVSADDDAPACRPGVDVSNQLLVLSEVDPGVERELGTPASLHSEERRV